MRKIQKAAVVAAMLGSIGFVGAGTAAAYDGSQHGKDIDITQANQCKSHDLNIALLNNIGVANGVLGNLLGGEGAPGAQSFDQGSKLACSNSAG
jgi:hypothetical protein